VVYFCWLLVKVIQGHW